MDVRRFCRRWISVLICFSLLTTFSVATAQEKSAEWNDIEVPFSFSLSEVTGDVATIELNTSVKISSLTLGVDDTKDVITPDTFSFSLSTNHSYSFEAQVDNGDSTAIYNGNLTFVVADDTKTVDLEMSEVVCNVVFPGQPKSAGLIVESEPNDSFSTADRTYDDYDNNGRISSTSDVDWWVVNFSKGGKANFWLGNIPSGCDYDIKLYTSNGSNGTNLLASSYNVSNQSELIQYPVVAGVDYYIRIHSFSGCSTSQYLFRSKNYPEVLLDRQYSTFGQTLSYCEPLQYRMNCYGYAIHVYSLSGSWPFGYLQQPGEFARDGETYQQLLQQLSNAMYGSSATNLLNFLEDRIYADFDTLNTYSGTEWTITSTTQSSSVPVGYRKIALTVDLGHDFHFYLRHSNGSWSHKPGTNPITNLSFDSGAVITDNNIGTAVREGGYDDGVRYYLIGKSAVIDYAHSAGNSYSTLYTPTSFMDCAGETITKAATVTGSSKSARFDYAEDIDFYEFSPSTSGTYTFTTSLTSYNYDVDMVIYNNSGDVLASDYSFENPSIALYLSAGSKYYIRVNDAYESVVSYTLYYRK